MAFISLLTIAAASLLLTNIAVEGVYIDASYRPFDLPLEESPFGFVTSDVSIGTPPQPLRLFVDWTWIGQYVLTPLCNGSLTDTQECLSEEQSIFNQTESTTFVNQSSTWPEQVWNPNQFYFDQDLSVQYGTDIERVGPASARIMIMAADMHFRIPEPYPFAGVFGMSPVFPGDNVTIQSAYYQMYEAGAFPRPQVSFLHCYNATFGNSAPPRSLCKGNDAIQTLNGYHPNHIRGPITWYDNIVFPAVNVDVFVYDPPIYNYWATGVTKHLIGDEEQALNTTVGSAAIFDHASYGRGAPMSTQSYARLRQLTNAKSITLSEDEAPNNGDQPFASVDCDEVASFPAIKYQLAGNERIWEIVPQNYVEKVNGSNGTVCVLNVRTLGGFDYSIGNFGETFAKDKVILLDFEALKVGVADARY